MKLHRVVSAAFVAALALSLTGCAWFVIQRKPAEAPVVLQEPPYIEAFTVNGAGSVLVAFGENGALHWNVLNAKYCALGRFGLRGHSGNLDVVLDRSEVIVLQCVGLDETFVERGVRITIRPALAPALSPPPPRGTLTPAPRPTPAPPPAPRPPQPTVSMRLLLNGEPGDIKISCCDEEIKVFWS